LGRKIQYVKLTPIDSASEVTQVLLGIDATTKHIYNLIEIGSNGTRTTLTVNSFQTNQPLSETLFTFDEGKYPDTSSIKLTKVEDPGQVHTKHLFKNLFKCIYHPDVHFCATDHLVIHF
jgi:hypothetical protein